MMKKVGVFVLVLLVLGVGGFFYLGQQSQSGAAPGLVDGQLSPCPSSPNCVTSEAHATAEQRVETFDLSSWVKLPTVVNDLGGMVTKAEGTYMAAEFTSERFKFVDDLEFRLASDTVHVRSASRVGYSDRGVNSARVAAIREMLAKTQ